MFRVLPAAVKKTYDAPRGQLLLGDPGHVVFPKESCVLPEISLQRCGGGFVRAPMEKKGCSFHAGADSLRISVVMRNSLEVLVFPEVFNIIFGEAGKNISQVLPTHLLG